MGRAELTSDTYYTTPAANLPGIEGGMPSIPDVAATPEKADSTEGSRTEHLVLDRQEIGVAFGWLLEIEQPPGLRSIGMVQAREIDAGRQCSTPLVASVPRDLVEAGGLELVHQRTHGLA